MILLFTIKVEAQISIEPVSPVSPVSNPNSAAGGQGNDEAINSVIAIVNDVESKNNFIDRLNPDSNVALPFGIIKQIGMVWYIMKLK